MSLQKKNFFHSPLLALPLRDRPPARPRTPVQASEQAVSYGPFIGVLTDVVKKGASASVGDRMPRLTALAEIHSREKIPAWHLYNSTRVDEDADDARAPIMDKLLLRPNKPVTTSMESQLQRRKAGQGHVRERSSFLRDSV